MPDRIENDLEGPLQIATTPLQEDVDDSAEIDIDLELEQELFVGRKTRAQVLFVARLLKPLEDRVAEVVLAGMIGQLSEKPLVMLCEREGVTDILDRVDRQAALHEMADRDVADEIVHVAEVVVERLPGSMGLFDERGNGDAVQRLGLAETQQRIAIQLLRIRHVICGRCRGRF